MATLEFNVGRAFCANIRNELTKAKFKGIIDDFHESSGIISRDFVVRGSKQNIDILRSQLEDWFNK